MMTHLFDRSEPFVSAIISGKGGVGKTMTSINVAGMLNEMGYKVAIIDADLGLANCATFFNHPVKATLCEWILGDCSLEDTFQDISGITLITAADDPMEVRIGTETIMSGLDQAISQLKNTHDYILIDTPAGAGEMTLWALDASDIGILMVVDEPSAISDVYRLCKYVYSIDPSYPFTTIVNFAENEEGAKSTSQRFNTILNHFLTKESMYLGFIPMSMQIRKAIQQQNTLLTELSENPINSELEFIAQNLISQSINLEKTTISVAY